MFLKGQELIEGLLGWDGNGMRRLRSGVNGMSLMEKKSTKRSSEIETAITNLSDPARILHKPKIWFS